MQPQYKTPGVYTIEQNAFPNSVVEVATAIPAFIGYTQQASYKGKDLRNVPTKVESLKEFQDYFGAGATQTFKLLDDAPGPTDYAVEAGSLKLNGPDKQAQYLVPATTPYYLYSAIQLFYQNGGSTCYIVSVGSYTDDSAKQKDLFEDAVKLLVYEQDPTMLLCPDAMRLDEDGYNEVMTQMLDHCAQVQSRVALFDVYQGAVTKPMQMDQQKTIDNFREGVGQNNLNYGIAYFPWVQTSILDSHADVSFLNLTPATLDVMKTALNPDPVPAGPAQSTTSAAPLTAAAATTAAKQVADSLNTDSATIDSDKDDLNKANDDLKGKPDDTGFQGAFDSAQKKADTAAATAATEAAAAVAAATTAAKLVLADADAIAQINAYHAAADAANKADDASKKARELQQAIEALRALPGDKGLLTALTAAQQAVDEAQVDAAAAANLAAQAKQKAAQATAASQAAATAATAATAGIGASLGSGNVPATASKAAAQVPALDGGQTPQNIFDQAKDLLVPITTTVQDLIKKGLNLSKTLTNAEINQLVAKSIIDKRLYINNSLTNLFPEYAQAMKVVARYLNTMPVAPAMAGVYTAVDSSRGVWKAPANVSLNAVVAPTVSLSDSDQGNLNVDALTGKSINAIRTFRGLGTMVWGGRTLDGNSQDWRYINVRRTMIMIEQSVKLAARSYVFEPNDANTWTTMKSMINNFLNNLWKQGALAGATPAEAYTVQIGLGSTMTANDILDGYLNVTVLVALVHPAEFIVLTFKQEMQTS